VIDEAAEAKRSAHGGVGVTVRSLSHSYPSAPGPVHVLRGLDLDLEAGSYSVLSGPSGSGKTTLLALVGGLERVQSGTLEVGGTRLDTLAGNGLAAYRRLTVGFVFQHFGLLDTLTALENVELAAALAGERPAHRRATARGLLEAVGLGHRASHRPSALSGGERQRVAIARALVNLPRLILADEPTGNLDDESSDGVMRLLESLHADRGCTLLVVSHDRAVARRAPVRFVLDHGRIAPR
jgi:putative ABC transport system ATP-binding protein